MAREFPAHHSSASIAGSGVGMTWSAITSTAAGSVDAGRVAPGVAGCVAGASCQTLW